MTVKDAARVMNISERTVYKASKVRQLRPDLGEELMAGRMSMDEAYRIATGKPKETSWDRLARAWNSATDDDRWRLMCLICPEEYLTSPDDPDRP